MRITSLIWIDLYGLLLNHNIPTATGHWLISQCFGSVIEWGQEIAMTFDPMLTSYLLSKGNTPLSRCVGCGHWIFDRVELKVFPDLRWHAECLKCVECQRNLAESNSCFIKDGKMLCRKDYHRYARLGMGLVKKKIPCIMSTHTYRLFLPK